MCVLIVSVREATSYAGSDFSGKLAGWKQLKWRCRTTSAMGADASCAAAEEWAQLAAIYRESGLTQKAFAKREGLKYVTFVVWLGRPGVRWTPSVGQVGRMYSYGFWFF
ncbi:MAG: hypothetical protein J6386_24225 [Candidatus Synoicihabitans palmerolidicus]|nr:hypothetical protein [Candidatus Synoicihabitans palmerolidicus]